MEVKKKSNIVIGKMALQWHITERCNWQCKHCYQEQEKSKELSLDELKNILESFVVFLKDNKISKEKAILQITGGEPLLRNDCFEFFKEIHLKKDFFGWVLMTNGSLLNKSNVALLKKLGCYSVQVSLEGLKNENDKIRGAGTFDLITEKVKLLLSEKMPTAISLTLTKRNYKDVFELATFFLKIVKQLDVKTKLILGARRIVPIGNGKELVNEMLEPNELREFYKKVYAFNGEVREGGNNLKIVIGCESGVFNNDIENDQWLPRSSCRVLSKSLITLMPDGEVYPCRRLPVSLGNIKEITFAEVLEGENYKKLSLQDNFKVAKECLFCSNVKDCFGGALCVTHAFSNGKSLSPDPQCWRLFKSLDDSKDYICNKKSFKKVLLKALQIVKNNLN
jgi:radical SAM protein with 4Fe4S-binding SPASM domain